MIYKFAKFNKTLKHDDETVFQEGNSYLVTLENEEIYYFDDIKAGVEKKLEGSTYTITSFYDQAEIDSMRNQVEAIVKQIELNICEILTSK